MISGLTTAGHGNAICAILASSLRSLFWFRNFSLFAQDTWHLPPRLTLTYGLRWDIDFAPSSLSGPKLAAVTDFSIKDLSQLALAPAGTLPFSTQYGAVAPRIGIAYQLNRKWQTVLRGGFGLFYDLATAEVGNNINTSFYPFGGIRFAPGSFPLTLAQAAPPAIVPPNASNRQPLNAFDPNLNLPYTLQWNVALEQGL